MSGEDRLEDAVRRSLADAGCLDRLKANVRRDIIDILNREDKVEIVASNNPEDFLIGELIKEWLAFRGLPTSRAALVAEAGLPKLDLERRELEANLNVACADRVRKIPLLYAILAKLRQG